MGKIRIGVSACLLGDPVRYDGGHKFDPILVESLSQSFELVPVCPEAELGLGVPREPMQLEGDPKDPRLMVIASRKDLTGSMLDWCGARFQSLENLCGFILKSRSPSCGLRVDVFEDGGSVPSAVGQGLFARAITERFPGIPVVEAEHLHDPGLRERFIERVRLAKNLSTTLERR